MVIQRFDVFVTRLDPTFGSEMRKTRPCVVVTPDEMNRHLSTVIVAPLTTGKHNYPFRVPCTFAGRDGQIALDQIRCVDRQRLTKNLGRLDPAAQTVVRKKLSAMLG